MYSMLLHTTHETRPFLQHIQKIKARKCIYTCTWWKSQRKPLCWTVPSVIIATPILFCSWVFWEQEAWHAHQQKGIYTDEWSLIYFSLWVCDVLLIGHQPGRLQPNQDQGKLVSLCRAFLLVAYRYKGKNSVHLISARFSSTAEGPQRKETRNENDEGKREKSLERWQRARNADRKICE